MRSVIRFVVACMTLASAGSNEYRIGPGAFTRVQQGRQGIHPSVGRGNMGSALRTFGASKLKAEREAQAKSGTTASRVNDTSTPPQTCRPLRHEPPCHRHRVPRRFQGRSQTITRPKSKGVRGSLWREDADGSLPHLFERTTWWRGHRHTQSGTSSIMVVYIRR